MVMSSCIQGFYQNIVEKKILECGTNGLTIAKTLKCFENHSTNQWSIFSMSDTVITFHHSCKNVSETAKHINKTTITK